MPTTPDPKNIFTKDFVYQDCLDVDLMLQSTEIPEAYPLIYREHQIKKWKSAFPNGNLLALWIGHAIFLKNYAKNSTNKFESEKNFICIAFSLYEPDDDEFLIPKLYVAHATRKKQIISICRKIAADDESPEVLKIKSAFEACGASNDFSFFEDRFNDPSGDGVIKWLYCIQSD